jgi:Flp pilus assembly protein TadD
MVHTPVKFVFPLILAVCAVLTFSHAKTWRTERDVWENAVSISPLAPGAHLGLGLAYQRLGDFSRAEYEYDEVIDLSRGTEAEPIYIFSVGVNLAKILKLSGKMGLREALLDHLADQFPEQRQAIAFLKNE